MKSGLGRIPLGVALWLLGTLPFLTRLVGGSTSHDVEHYMLSANALLDGQRIYVDVPFEYPPCTCLRGLPGRRCWQGTSPSSDCPSVYSFCAWTRWSRRRSSGPAFATGSARPMRCRLSCTALATAAVGHILLQRYDVFRGAVGGRGNCTLGGMAGVAGLVAAVAVGTKVYPALFVPVLAVLAWRRSPRDAKRFAIGLVAGFLPLIALSWSVPWWRFATVHTQRGLEAESLWASAVWLSHFVGVPATWEFVIGWMEVTGPVAERLLTPARIIWATATLGSVALATWAAWRRVHRSGEDADTVSLSVSRATLMLLPVTTSWRSAPS